MAEKRKHPSGRPIRAPKVGVRSHWRIPGDGFELPRLQRRFNTQAIGFVHSFSLPSEDEEGKRR